MGVVEPPIKSTVLDRGRVQTKAMDYSMEVVYEERNHSVKTIHIRTIPPGLTETNLDYWMEVVNEYDEVRAFECKDLWVTVHVTASSMDVLEDTAKYAAEAYYNIFNNLA